MKPDQDAIRRRKEYLSSAGPTLSGRTVKPASDKTAKKNNYITAKKKKVLNLPVAQSTLQPQASTYPYPSPYPNYPYYGTKPAGGRTFAGLAEYAPETIIDHYASRMQARKTDKESVECRGMLKRNNSYVVGKGLVCDPEPDHETIGITAEQAEEWGRPQKHRFALWCKSKGSDITGTNNFYQNMRLAHRIKDRDGECFVRFHYSDDQSLLNPLQISFVDSNQVRGDEFTFTSGPYSQDDGIIKDKNGKPIAYKIWVEDKQNEGKYKDITVDAFDKKTGRPLMLHLFEPEYPGQTRGIPKINHAIQDFNQITGYNTAALTRMENGATFNFTSENDQQDPSDLDLSTLNRQSAGVETKLPAPTTSTGPEAIGADAAYYTGIPDARLNETGVNIFGARQGDKLKATPDLSPAESAQSFTTNKHEHISASLGMSPEVALMKTSTSFTAAKGAFGMQDKEAAIERADLESDLNDIAYFAWTAEEIAAGRTQAPGWSDPIIRDAWLQNRWIAPPPIDLKPSDTAKANAINIELGLTDLDTAAEQLNGSSGSANRAKNAKQIPELTPLPGSKAAEQDTDTEEEDDDDTGNSNDNASGYVAEGSNINKLRAIHY